MTAFWLFLHLFAFTIWIGGWLSTLAAASILTRLDRPLWGGVAEAQAAIHRMLIGPGAIVSVASGLLLTFRMYGALSGQVGPWLGTMQGLGIIAAAFTLLGAVPAASRLSRLEPTGATAAAFDRAHRRMLMAGSIGGVLAVVALIAGTLYR